MSADPTWLAGRAISLDFDSFADSLESASVVGLAPTTREAQEVADLQADLALALIDRGTSILVLQIDTDLAGRLQAWIDDSTEETFDAISAELWGPWQIQPVADLMHRLRARRRSGARIALRGLSRPSATTADYDTVVEQLGGTDQEADVVELFATIRVAHDGGEHVERAHGRWDGPPFVDLARNAADLARQALADLPEARDAAAPMLERIIRFHEQSISQGYDESADEREAADALLDTLRRTGRRAVIWDGIGHLAGTGTVFGTRLRDALRDDYQCVVTTFGGGRLRDFTLPAPTASSLDAALVEASGARSGSMLIDLRTVDDGPEWLHGNHRARLISGMYDPDDDGRHYMQVTDLGRAVDVLIHLPVISPASALR